MFNCFTRSDISRASTFKNSLFLTLSLLLRFRVNLTILFCMICNFFLRVLFTPENQEEQEQSKWHCISAVHKIFLELRLSISLHLYRNFNLELAFFIISLTVYCERKYFLCLKEVVLTAAQCTVWEGVMAKPQAHVQFDGQTVCQVDTVKSSCHSWAQATPLYHSFLASYLLLETFLPEVFSDQYFLYPFIFPTYPIRSECTIPFVSCIEQHNK